ncbi:MAG TPA: bacteriohopanetetrol glucosamine biosynthesis glycosyltransferase HpnI [Steroidobacteraceae bacterium]|nr:bacteriohopanetetrol glucosamine biosynthesis glycosyltransferase HpnI [Steroidobacteraceae bacterium]
MSKDILLWCGFGIAALAMAYGLVACIAVRLRIRPERAAPQKPPSVTVLKPLCGLEAETYECLRSFCDQSYPDFEVIFGIRDADDGVVAVVERLQQEFPQRRILLVVDRRLHGSSRKVSNLINMWEQARHEYLIMADSDVRVRPDYLRKIVAPLLDQSVGVVTCAYTGVPRGDFCSRLAAMFINEWFIPSVRVAAMYGSRAFAFGATIALRRKVLADIGGFAAIANQLADDYRLGELTRRLGLRTVLSDVVVEICVSDSDFGELVRHELRWLRTIRMLQPLGYGLSFVTLGVPVGALGVALAGGAVPAAVMFAIASAARMALHLSARTRGWGWLALVGVPMRDVLTSGLWIWSFTTRQVHWRERRYEVAADGTVEPV